MGTTIYTIGHGTYTPVELTDLLHGAGVKTLVDVRRYPGSRKHPEMGQDALREWLPRDAGIAYRWEENLGGRRHIPAGEPQPDSWWRVEAFRAYAAYTRTSAFGEGIRSLRDIAQQQPTSIMCSETVWWRCHRRLIADVLTLKYDVDVRHLMPSGKVTEHPLADGARLRENGTIFWDRPDPEREAVASAAATDSGAAGTK